LHICAKPRDWLSLGFLRPASLRDVPAKTDASIALSKDLRKRGWSFVGPTTMYAFMQAVGLVNDHLVGCHVREVCGAAQAKVSGKKAASHDLVHHPRAQRRAADRQDACCHS
jgi:hypothetical protein